MMTAIVLAKQLDVSLYTMRQNTRIGLSFNQISRRNSKITLDLTLADRL